jgi:hypothetical protein
MHENEKPITPLAEVSAEVDALMQALAAPFDPREVKFKPAVVSGHRAMAMAYIDARVIQDRLDEVLGGAGWQDEYECLPDGSVVCRLRLRLGSEWITKMDVGGPSEQPDEGDRRKAAFSDALKRAAVKFGIGRYLYRLPAQWVDYDPQKRQFVRPPQLPAHALPRPKKDAAAPPKREKEPAVSVRVAKEPAPAPKEAAKESGEKKPTSALPANGAELQRRLYNYDAVLAKQGMCQPGELVKHVVQAGVKAGYEGDLSTWSGNAIGLAVEETKTFENKVRQQKNGERKEVA